VPNRDIKESCRSSETLALLSHGAERLFWRLTTLADDFGRFDARVAVVRAECFKVMLEKIRPLDVERWLGELATSGLVYQYTVGGKPYGEFVTWAQHQRQRATNSKWPSRASCDPPRTSAGNGGRPQANALEEPEVTEEPEEPEGTARTAGSAAVPAALGGWKIPDPVMRALDRAPHFAKIRGFNRLRHDAAWWYAETRAHPSLDCAACVLAIESWLVTYPTKAARKRDAVAFLHNWLKEEASRG